MTGRPDALLLADRDSPLQFPDPRDTLSSDLDAPALAQAVFEITLSTMNVTEFPPQNGNAVQVARVSETAFAEVCERTIEGPAAPSSGDQWRTLGRPFDNVLTIEIDGEWIVPQGSEQPGCDLGRIDFAPIRLKGVIQVIRHDADAFVEVRFTEELPDEFDNLGSVSAPGRVAPFPAFEMYASLDDGNLVPVFRHLPETSWAPNPSDTLVAVPPEQGNLCDGARPCPAGVARLYCGCRDCDPEEDCIISGGGVTTCPAFPSYFVLVRQPAFAPDGQPVFDPSLFPDCEDADNGSCILADGPLAVFIGDDERPVYVSDPHGGGTAPPIGFLAFQGDRIRLEAAGSERSRMALNDVHLLRIDGRHGPVVVQQPPQGGYDVGPTDNGRVETTVEIELSRSGLGSPICCRDRAGVVCADRKSSRNHCGGCNRPCAEDRVCVSNACQCRHPLKLHLGRCVDPTQDANACGPDLVDCTVSGKICAGSQCAVSGCESPGLHVCDGQCVPLNDRDHCGPGCEACLAPPNAEPTCDGVHCGFICLPGFHTCDSLTCQDDFDALHCGVPCVQCPVPDNGTAFCNAGFCEIRCNGGFHTCDGISCLDNASAAHCGEACAPCPDSLPVCIAGNCCWSGANAICGIDCVDINQNHNNCGFCGNVCFDGRCCVNGECRSDHSFCGDCFTTCGSFEVCEFGQCVFRPPDPPAGPDSCGECEFWNGASCVPVACPPDG